MSVLYFLLAGTAAAILYSLCYPENIYLDIFMMLLSGEEGIIGSAVLILMLLTLPAFLMFLYNSLSLFFLCLGIEREKCFIKTEGRSVRYSFPEIGNGWSAAYSGGYADLKPVCVKKISLAESWRRFHLVPVREIIIEFSDGRSLVIDCVFFKEHLSDIKARLEFMAFPDTAPEPQEKPGYREGESILDEDGNFIPPG
jgi:hypothetical protein